MVYQIQKINRPKIEKVYGKAMKELSSFFGINWKYNLPPIILVPDRKVIDSLRGEKTEGWLVGWVDKNKIYMLDKKDFEKESSHKYSEKEFSARIKHELAHCFSRIASDGVEIPTWLAEGISIFLSNQNIIWSRPKPKKFGIFIESYDAVKKGVYAEAGFAVEFLVKKYGKKKLFFLLKGLKKANTKQKFTKLFKSIYGFDLAYNNFKVL